MCHFEPHRSEDEYEFFQEPDEPDEDVDAEFEDEFEEAEDVRIVTDGGDD